MTERAETAREPHQDLRERLDRHFHASRTDALDRLYKDDVFNPNSEKTRQITEHLTQSSSELGIYGVTVKETETPVISVLGTYLDKNFRQQINKRNVEKENPQDYFSATAEAHGVSVDAVRASVNYYHRHEDAFDAYFTYQESLQNKDPLVEGNQPPHQLPLEEK